MYSVRVSLENLSESHRFSEFIPMQSEVERFAL